MNKNSPIDYIALGNRIKQTRISNNLTQAQLGESCSLSTSHIGHIERGTRTLSVDTLYAISSALNVSMDYLVLDSSSEDNSLLITISAGLSRHNKRRVNAFLKVVKILYANIEEL